MVEAGAEAWVVDLRGNAVPSERVIPMLNWVDPRVERVDPMLNWVNPMVNHVWLGGWQRWQRRGRRRGWWQGYLDGLTLCLTGSFKPMLN